MIKQPKNGTGCGVACLANVISQTYRTTLKKLKDTACRHNNGNMTVDHMLTYINEHTLLSARKENAFNSNKTCFLVFLRWPTNKRYKHWVIYQGGWYYDPDSSVTSRTRHYETKPECIIAIYADKKFRRPHKIALRHLLPA